MTKPLGSWRFNPATDSRWTRILSLTLNSCELEQSLLESLLMCTSSVKLWPEVKEIFPGTSQVEFTTPLRYSAPAAIRRATQRQLEAWGIPAMPAHGLKEAQLVLALHAELGPESYHLQVGDAAIRLHGGDPAGLFYGLQTLGQWVHCHGAITASGVSMASVQIEDEPDIAARGLMLDISRDKVPTMATLFELVDLMVAFKLNELQLYMEHTFAYRGHEIVWRHASPMTAEELGALDAYCRDRFIELVPNQNSFGHFHRWLVHPRYRPLAECPDGIEHPFSPTREPFSLCATDERVFELLSDLYHQLLPCFSSKKLNVGLDEAFDLGSCRSARAAAVSGKGTLFVRYLQRLRDLAAVHGHSLQYWADMVLGEQVPLSALPEDGTALLWGYEADHPFDEQCAKLRAADIAYYVCPGTSSWNSFIGRTENATRNLASAALAGEAHGANGYLITDWGDNGHHQPLSVSYRPIITGAGFAWRTSSAREVDEAALDGAMDGHLGVEGAAGLLARLGDAHQLTPARPKNSTAPFNLVLRPTRPLDHAAHRKITVQGLADADREVRDCCESLATIATATGPAELLSLELGLAGDFFRLGCALGIARLQSGGERSLGHLSQEIRTPLGLELRALTERQRTLWIHRNRPGGLRDSVARLDPLRALLS